MTKEQVLVIISLLDKEIKLMNSLKQELEELAKG